MNLLVTGAWHEAKENTAVLENMGHHVLFQQWEQEDLPCSPDWAEGVICNGLFQKHDIRKFRNLKYLQLMSAGYDRVDMDYIKSRGITIHNVGDTYVIPMAEFVLAGVLDLYKQRRSAEESQRRHDWKKASGILELYGKKVLILGCGNVGEACAKRFRAFGCEVTGINRTIRKSSSFHEMLGLSMLDEKLPEADILVITIALTEETVHLLHEERLGRLKPTAVLVNAARGRLIDEEALVRRLPSLGGAVLDVFEEEPLSESSPLWDMKNVYLTSHSSYIGEGNAARLKKIIMDNLNAYGK